MRVIACHILLLVFGACTYVPFDAPRTTTRALPFVGTEAAEYADSLSGGGSQNIAMAPLIDGNDALGARLQLIAASQHSIDLKTFLIKPDIAGTLTWLELYKAAERGVRVRLLFDDVFTTARDEQIATLDAHPNVEIRVFNPLSRHSIAALNYLFDFSRVNRRMHNKAMISDGAIAIVGGRNIADEYYQIGTDNEFADFDLFVAGNPITDLSAAFDLYWNDKWSVPIAALEDGDITLLLETLEEFRSLAESEEVRIYQRAVNSTYLKQLENGTAPIFLGTAKVVVDDPEKLRNHPGSGPYVVGNTLYNTMNTAENDLLILTPYFIPEDYGERFFKSLVDRGVQVRVVTNSLASTNHPYVHGFYAHYRKRLLRAGVNFLEIRADAPSLVENVDAPLTMHSKLAVIDGKKLFVGSTNLDPRSIRQNSEIGMVIHSSGLAKDILKRVDSDVADYTFTLSEGPKEEIIWIYNSGSQTKEFQNEPQSNAWSRVLSTVTSWLPIESQL